MKPTKRVFRVVWWIICITGALLFARYDSLEAAIIAGMFVGAFVTSIENAINDASIHTYVNTRDKTGVSRKIPLTDADGGTILDGAMSTSAESKNKT